jgi:preprotein translocase subunit SecA
MHVQVIAAPAEDPDYDQAAFVAADDPVTSLGELSEAPAAELSGVSPQTSSGLTGQAPAAAVLGSGAASGAGATPGKPQPAATSGRPEKGSTRGGNGGGNAQRGAPGGSIAPSGTRIVGATPAKVGRNEPCWCGSGRKFKVCHGAS